MADDNQQADIPAAADPDAQEQQNEEQQTVNDSSEEVTGQEGAEVAEEAPQNHDVPEWARKRFGELTKQRTEAEAKAQRESQEKERLAMELARLRAGQQPDQQQHQQPGQTQQPANEDERIRQEAQRIVQAQQFDERCNQTYNQGVTEFQDFDAALNNLHLVGISQQALADITTMPDSHKILYQLGKNPGNAERILAMSPMQMGIELAKLSTAAPAQKPVSRAPAPISPVGGAATAEPDYSKLSDDEWFARERARK